MSAEAQPAASPRFRLCLGDAVTPTAVPAATHSAVPACPDIRRGARRLAWDPIDDPLPSAPPRSILLATRSAAPVVHWRPPGRHAQRLQTLLATSRAVPTSTLLTAMPRNNCTSTWNSGYISCALIVTLTGKSTPPARRQGCLQTRHGSCLACWSAPARPILSGSQPHCGGQEVLLGRPRHGE